MTNCDIALFLGTFSFLALIITWVIIVKLYQNSKWQDARINAMREAIDDRYTRMLRGWRDPIKTAQELINATSELIDAIKGENNHDSE